MLSRIMTVHAIIQCLEFSNQERSGPHSRKSSSLLTNLSRLVMLTLLCTVFMISGTKSGVAQTQELAANQQAGDQHQSATELAQQATNPYPAVG